MQYAVGMPNLYVLANSLPPIVWALLAGFILTGADIVFRYWQDTPWRGGFWVALGIYTVGVMCMMFTFFGKNIAIATMLTVLINMISYLVVAYFIFGDTLSPIKLFGLGLGLIAIFVLELSH